MIPCTSFTTHLIFLAVSCVTHMRLSQHCYQICYETLMQLLVDHSASGPNPERIPGALGHAS